MKQIISFFKVSMRLWRRHLAGVLIGVIGLACAFAVSLMAGFYLYDSVRSDAWLEGVESLYRVENRWLPNGKPGVFGRTANAPHDAKAVIEANMPELGPLARMVNVDAAAMKGDTPLPTKLSLADPGFGDLIPLPMVHGSLKAIHNTKNAIALSETEAMRMLGSHTLGPNIIGQTVSFRLGKEMFDFQLVAVFRDIPSNSHLTVGAIANWNEAALKAAVGDHYDWKYAHTYFRMPEGADAKDVGDRITNDMSPLLKSPWGTTINSMSVQPVLGVLYHSKAHSDMRPSVNIKKLRVLATIGGLLLLVAAFNFVNLFTSLNLTRAREIAMRRIAGAGRGHLTLVFLAEAALISLAAFGLATLLASDMSDYGATLLNRTIPIIKAYRLPLLAMGAGLAVMIGFLAAFYAVARISRIQPQSLLHGTQQSVLSGGSRLKAVLVGVQSLAVVGCLLAAGQAMYQFDHLTNLERGIKTNGILTIDAPEDRDLNARFRDAYFNELQAIPGVVDAARLDDTAFSGRFYIVRYLPRGGTDVVETGFRLVGPDYFDMINITPLARSAEDWHGLQGVIALPYKSLSTYGFDSPEEAIDQVLRRIVTRDGKDAIEENRIMAVVPDIKDMSRGGPKAQVYKLSATPEDQNINNIMLVADRDDPTIEAKTREIWARHFPDEKADIEWLTDRIARFYSDVSNIGEAILIMGGMCLVLCFAGLYGMASHFTATRAREIALRRVLGAEGRALSALFLRKMLLPVAIGGMIALVPTWYLLGLWLQEMEEQAPLPAFYFMGVPAAVLVIASVILAGQLRQVLRLRPARVLHHE